MNIREREVLTGKLWILMFAVAMIIFMISAPAHAEENDVASISFDPGKDITLLEYVDGFYDTNSKGVDYFHYEYSFKVIYALGAKLTVTNKAGVSTVYTCIWDEETRNEIYVSESGDTIETHSLETYDEQWDQAWKKGKNYITIIYQDVKCQVPIYIKENPFVSISFDPGKRLTVIENVTGFYDDSGKERYFNYYQPTPFIPGAKVTLTDKDGVSTEYTYVEEEDGFAYVSEAGEKFDNLCFSTSDTQSKHHWTKGGENYLTIIGMGAKCQVPVYVIDNPIAFISYDPGEEITLIEYRDGGYAMDNEDESYFRYTYPAYCTPGSKLTITGKDGVATVYTCLYDKEIDEYEYESESGDRLDRFYLDSSDDQILHHWTKGVNYYTITYLGIECQASVYIEENPIASISFNPAEDIILDEYLDGYYTNEYREEEYFLYQYPSPFIAGSKLTLTDRKGVSTEYTCIQGEFDNTFVSESGEVISTFDLSVFDDQHENPWMAGGDNYITIIYQGASCRIPVTVKENTIVSISYKPSRPVVFTEGENIETWPEEGGRYVSNVNIDLPYQGDTLVINYKDGSSKSYVYDSGFVNVTDGSDTINAQKLSFEPGSGYWKYGPNNYITVTYYGRSANIKVSLKKSGDPDPVEIPATNLTLASKKLYLKKGDSYKISYILTPLNSTDDVTYTSSNKKVATVSSTGKIKAKGKGTAKITVKTSSGKSVIIKVNVAKKATKTKKVTVAKKLTLKAGAVKFIAYKRKPTKTTDKVTFKSSKKSVVTVDSNGKLIAKKKGTAKITIKSGKKKAVCKITVK